MDNILLDATPFEKKYVIYKLDCAVLKKLTTKGTTQFLTIEDAERCAESYMRNVYRINCIWKKKKTFVESEYLDWRKTYDIQLVIIEYYAPYKTRIVKLIN